MEFHLFTTKSVCGILLQASIPIFLKDISVTEMITDPNDLFFFFLGKTMPLLLFFFFYMGNLSTQFLKEKLDMSKLSLT